MISVKDRVVAHLRELAAGTARPTTPVNGLCWELGEFFAALTVVVKNPRHLTLHDMAYKRTLTEFCVGVWPHYSGSRLYPVPRALGVEGAEGAEEAYRSCAADYMWSPHVDYGKARLKLCADFADWLETEWDEYKYSDYEITKL